MSTLVVADSRGVYLEGLKWVLRKAGHAIVSECLGVFDVVACVERHQPDIVIVSIHAADLQAASLSSRLRAVHDAPGIIFILQPNGGLDIKDIQGLGADGLLMDGTSLRDLVECVEAVAGGDKWVDHEIVENLLMTRPQVQSALRLTSRETEIVDLVSRGLRNKTIAQRLNLSEGTVKMHLHHVYAKLNLRSRAELAWAAHGVDRPNKDLL